MRNSRTDFPVIACALSEAGGSYRVAIGARPGRAVLITDEDNILSGGINPDSITKFASHVASNVRTGSNMRGSAEFRTHLINVLVTRGLQELEELEL
jgi:CO/xanthine dehydrogenase FAD-binding subunit